jgi:hypothetical protein
MEVEEVTALAEAARGGDLEAFRRLVVRFQDMAYGYCRQLISETLAQHFHFDTVLHEILDNPARQTGTILPWKPFP